MPEDELGEGSEDDLIVPPPSPDEIIQALAETVVQEEINDPPAVEVESDPVEFDPKYRNAFEGLLFIGKASRQFKWMGHSFKIRTPYVSELLELGQLHKPYSETVSDIKAYQALMIAAVIETIDDKPLPIPISQDMSGLEAKFHYIMKNWYPWTLDRIYEQYMLLDAEVQEVMNAMGKA